ncbi:MAG: response regulator transcription factor [Candidatus Acidiferrales bacterium]
MGSSPHRMTPPAKEKTRVFVAESTRMAGQMIEAALYKHRREFQVRAVTSESADVFRELEKNQPHVAILSAELRDGSLTGFRVLRQLRDSQMKTAAIMLLNSTDRDLVVDAFRFGARGVFTRMHSIEALPKCISAVRKGQVWVNNDQIEFLLELIMRLRPQQTVKPGGMALLTKREQEVVRHVAEGMRNEEISQVLHVTEHTVRNYLCRIFDKLGLSSRVELVLYALSR